MLRDTLDALVAIDTQGTIRRWTKPLVIVHSEAVAIPDGVRTFVKGFTGQATVRWLEEKTSRGVE